MIRVNFHLTERQIAWLHEEAKKTGLSVAELIRRSVDAYAEKADKLRTKRGQT